MKKKKLVLSHAFIPQKITRNGRRRKFRGNRGERDTPAVNTDHHACQLRRSGVTYHASTAHRPPLFTTDQQRARQLICLSNGNDVLVGVFRNKLKARPAILIGGRRRTGGLTEMLPTSGTLLGKGFNRTAPRLSIYYERLVIITAAHCWRLLSVFSAFLEMNTDLSFPSFFFPLNILHRID